MTPDVIDAGGEGASGTVFDDASPELTRTYAEALVNAAEQAGRAEAALDDLEAIARDVFGRYPLLATLMTSPVRSEADKDRLITRTLEGRAEPIVVRFLRVLNRRGRMDLLAPIARAARASWDRRQGRREVLVRSAVPLTDSQTRTLRERLVASMGIEPVLKATVDPGLIGGLIVQVGDDVYDASVRSRLEQLRTRLLEGQTHEIQSRRDHFADSE